MISELQNGCIFSLAEMSVHHSDNTLSVDVRKPSQPYPVSHQSPRGDERAHAVYAVQPVSICSETVEPCSVGCSRSFRNVLSFAYYNAAFFS